jgi:nitrogen fixation NifU-like protein
MPDLNDLYQELIIDHSRRPHNRRRPTVVNREAQGFNPLCGDRVTLYLNVENDVVKDAAFEGSGCAISTASASIMTDSLKGKTVAEARALFEKFHELVTGEANTDVDLGGLGKLAVFSGVGRFPARVKCATLAWHALTAALENVNEVVSTE